MRNKAITTTMLAAAVLLSGALITQAQTSVNVEAQQRTEVQSSTEAEEERAQRKNDYNNSVSNSGAASNDTDSDGDGYGETEPSEASDTRANSTTSAEEVDANDEDDDGDGVPDLRAGGVTKEIDKASPKLLEALSIDEDSPLRNAGVEIGVDSEVCAEADDCDDEDASVSAGKADVAIRVSGDKVRGWSDERKEAVRTRLEAASELTTANDFGLRVASAALGNGNLVDIFSDKDVTEVRYKTQLRLFGFIPTQTTAIARATSDGEVSLKYPWYSFLARKDDNSPVSQLVSDLRADHDVMISVEEEGVKRTIRDDQAESN